MGKYTVIIGLDPAFREGGFGTCVIHENVVEFSTLRDFTHLLGWCASIELQGIQVKWCIENSNLDNTTYAYLRKGNIKQLMAQSRSVGKNQAFSQVVTDYLTQRFGADNVTAISPKQKGAKWGVYNGKRNMSVAREIAREVGEREKLTSIGWQTATGDQIDAFQIAMHIYRKKV